MATAHAPHGPHHDLPVEELVDRLSRRGVLGVQVVWCDNNGITRSRVVPVTELTAVARRGVGTSTVFAVFDSLDAISPAHFGGATAVGDVRLVPVLEQAAEQAAAQAATQAATQTATQGVGLVPLAGQPRLAWVAGRQVSADGDPWPYCQRAVLERQVAAAERAGFAVRAGYEIEMYVARAADPEEPDALVPASRGPAYSALALLEVDELVARLLDDLSSHGLGIGQLHAEYGGSQLELALDATDPLSAADGQLLARQTIHAAARDLGLRVSFAPVATTTGVGNGWHLHTSLLDAATGDPVMAGPGEHGLSEVGRGYVGGLLRDLHAVAAVTAPSTGSLLRRRPGHWAGAYACWGVENREAVLRLVPGSALLGPGHTNVELKASDASANPYLALAVTIAAGLRGVADGADLPQPVQEDVGTWTQEARDAAGIVALATTHEEQRAHLLGSDLVREVLGEELLGAFVTCRDSDAAWAAEHTTDEAVAALRWRY